MQGNHIVTGQEGTTPKRRFFDRHRLIAVVIAAAVLLYAYVVLASWTDRTMGFMLAIGLVLLLLLLLDWVVASLGPPLWRLSRSLASSVAGAVAHDPVLAEWLSRHPRLDGFLRGRLTLEDWRGRYLTVIVLLALAFLYGFVSIARDLATTSSIVANDPGIAALLRAFRTPGVTRVLWIATITGDTRVEVAVAGVFVLLLLVWGRRSEAVLAAVTIPAAALTGSVIKVAAARPRPPSAFALIHGPSTMSFPSGHALGSFVFYGLLAFVLLRTFGTTGARRFGIVALAALAAFLVGVSRVYLGVHWPSDVVASWFLGAAILTVAIGAFLSWERYAPHGPPAEPLWTPRTRRVVTGASAVLVVVAVTAGAQADPLLQRVIMPTVAHPFATSSGTAYTTALPRFSEKLDGAPQEPVSLVFVGTEAQLKAAFAAAGWQLADSPSVGGVLRAYVAGAADQPYPTAPMTPSFIGGAANAIGFERPAGRPTARRRHHARFWTTDVTLGGVPVWVGTASFDAGVGMSRLGPFPTHRIDPAVDRERDLIAGQLTASGDATRTGTWQVTRPELGTNANGDAFFTDGVAVLLRSR